MLLIGAGAAPHQRDRPTQRLLDVRGQRFALGEAAAVARAAEEAQVLLAEARRRPCTSPSCRPELRVVAQLGMRVQRQVVGEQVDVVRPAAGPGAASSSRSRGRPGRARTGRGARRSHRPRRAIAASISARLAVTPETILRTVGAPFDLQAVGPVVLEALRAASRVSKACEQFVASRAHARDCIARARAVSPAPSRRWRQCARPGRADILRSMKRIWLLFAQAVTVLLAAYFVVATLKPEWLGKRGHRSAAWCR